jgi:hypothetical protein
MRPAIFSSLLLLAAFIGGCGEDHMNANMGAELDRTDQHMTELQSELDQHAGNVAAATDLATATAEESRHQPMAMGHTGDMMSMMGDMMQMCRHMSSNAAPDMMGMSGMMQSMRDECDRHRTAMGGAPDLAAAQAEETRHMTSMRDMMGRMRDMMGTARGQASNFHCGGAGHGM